MSPSKIRRQTLHAIVPTGLASAAPHYQREQWWTRFKILMPQNVPSQ